MQLGGGDLEDGRVGGRSSERPFLLGAPPRAEGQGTSRHSPAPRSDGSVWRAPADGENQLGDRLAKRSAKRWFICTGSLEELVEGFAAQCWRERDQRPRFPRKTSVRSAPRIARWNSFSPWLVSRSWTGSSGPLEPAGSPECGTTCGHGRRSNRAAERVEREQPVRR